jgi:hypothetical protein
MVWLAISFLALAVGCTAYRQYRGPRPRKTNRQELDPIEIFLATGIPFED